jgi:flagellar biosynthetic protein FliR
VTFSYEFTLNIVQLLAVISRLFGLFMGFPLFRGSTIPVKTKMSLILMTALIILPGLPESWSAENMLPHLSIFGLFMLMLNDIIIGLTVSLTVNLLLETVNLLGQFLSINMGFSMSQQFDPASGTQSSSLSVMFTQIFIVLFLAFDMHLQFIRISVKSFAVIEPGKNILTPDHLSTIIDLGSSTFMYAFQVSLPIVAVMLLVNTAMGIIARFGQDFNVLMISFPLRLGVGLTMLIVLMPVFTSFFMDLQVEILEKMGLVLGL